MSSHKSPDPDLVERAGRKTVDNLNVLDFEAANQRLRSALRTVEDQHAQTEHELKSLRSAVSVALEHHPELLREIQWLLARRG